MFDMFKRKPEPTPQPKLRGVLPTYLTQDLVLLSKAAPSLRNTYEIRLAVYMAKSKGLRFILAVKPQTIIDTAVVSLLQEHGGQIEEASLKEYSVYFGYEKPNGEEDGWVLGDAESLLSFTNSIQSQWLLNRLKIGANFTHGDLETLEQTLLLENISASNIDGENVRDALLFLVRAARQQGGTVFIQ